MKLEHADSAISERYVEASAQQPKSESERSPALLAITLVSIALLLAGLSAFSDRVPVTDTAQAAPAPGEAARPADYFPDAYSNRATEPERQYETF